LARIEVPQGMSCLSFDCLKRFRIVGEENKSACCRESSSPGVTAPSLRILPDFLPVGGGKREQNLSRLFTQRMLRTCPVKSLALSERLRFGEIKIAVLQGHYIKETAGWTVRRREPIRGPYNAGTNIGAVFRWDSSRKQRASVRIDARGPVQLFDKW